jgi:hypothetical protein
MKMKILNESRSYPEAYLYNLISNRVLKNKLTVLNMIINVYKPNMKYSKLQYPKGVILYVTRVGRTQMWVWPPSVDRHN